MFVSELDVVIPKCIHPSKLHVVYHKYVIFFKLKKTSGTKYVGQ